MNIAFYTSHFPPESIGGAEIQSLRLCNRLAELNDVTVFIRKTSRKNLELLKKNNFTIQERYKINIPILRPLFDFIYSIIYIIQHRSKYDLFITYKIQNPALILTIVNNLVGVKYIVSPRGEVDYKVKNILKHFLFKVIYKNATAILIQTESIKIDFIRELEKIFYKQDNIIPKIVQKIIISPNGIDKHNIKKAAILSSKVQLMFVGRLIESKGVEYIIKSIPLIKNDIELIIIGDGEDKNRLYKMAQGLPITFLGELPYDEISSQMMKGDIFIFPSLSENMPNAIIEALSHGMPCISTPVGAIPDIIKNNYNGYLIPLKSHEEIANSVDNILSDEKKYSTMQSNALESIITFRWDNILPVLETSLRQIVYKN